MHRRHAVLLAVLFAAPAAALADDTTPPVIHHTPIASAKKGDQVTVSAVMEDESEIFAPTLYYRYPNARGYSSMAMTRKGDSFVAAVPATADIDYWIEAYDEFGNGPSRDGSPEKPHHIQVVEKAAKVAPAKPAITDNEPPPPPPPPPPEEKAQMAEANPPPPPPPRHEEIAPVPVDDPVYKKGWFIGTVAGVVVLAAVGVTVGLIASRPSAPTYDTVDLTIKK